MNKDDHCSLSLNDRFNLFLSDPAIDRELLQIKKPTISVENLPSSIYYRPPQQTAQAQKKAKASVAAAATKRRTKKQEAKKAEKIALNNGKEDNEEISQSLVDKSPENNEENLGNEQLTELLRCAACLSVPIYPKECKHCTKIVCDSCLNRYDKSNVKQRNGVVCFLCKSTDTDCFRNIQSKLLQDILDKIKVGHRCTRFQELNVYTVAELRKHAESGNCKGYQYTCFCRSDYRYSYEAIRKHLREECPMVRLQCRYCHAGHDYPSGNLDVQQINHFNGHSMTREQFKSQNHSCYLEQKKIDDSLQNPDNLSKLKMLLLQKSIPLKQKIKCGKNQNQDIVKGLGGMTAQQLKVQVDNLCKYDKCLYGWFDEPAPRYINQVQLEIFDPKKKRIKNGKNYECQRCKKDYEYLYQGPGDSCLSKKHDVLLRCSKCMLPICKFCLQNEVDLNLESEEETRNQTLSSNEVTLQSILNLLEIKFEKNIKDSSDPFNAAPIEPVEQLNQDQRLNQQFQSRSSQEFEGIADTEPVQIIESDNLMDSAAGEDGHDQYGQSARNFRSQLGANPRGNLQLRQVV